MLLGRVQVILTYDFLRSTGKQMGSGGHIGTSLIGGGGGAHGIMPSGHVVGGGQSWPLATAKAASRTRNFIFEYSFLMWCLNIKYNEYLYSG